VISELSNDVADLKEFLQLKVGIHCHRLWFPDREAGTYWVTHFCPAGQCDHPGDEQMRMFLTATRYNEIHTFYRPFV
jgi:hypothetical protein